MAFGKSLILGKKIQVVDFENGSFKTRTWKVWRMELNRDIGKEQLVRGRLYLICRTDRDPILYPIKIPNAFRLNLDWPLSLN